MGIIEHAKAASTAKQIEDIRKKIKSSDYRFASAKTIRKVNRILKGK